MWALTLLAVLHDHRSDAPNRRRVHMDAAVAYGKVSVLARLVKITLFSASDGCFKASCVKPSRASPDAWRRALVAKYPKLPIGFCGLSRSRCAVEIEVSVLERSVRDREVPGCSMPLRPEAARAVRPSLTFVRRDGVDFCRRNTPFPNSTRGLHASKVPRRDRGTTSRFAKCATSQPAAQGGCTRRTLPHRTPATPCATSRRGGRQKYRASRRQTNVDRGAEITSGCEDPRRRRDEYDPHAG